MDKKSVAKNYRFLAILLSCMVAGALLGWFRPKWGHSIAFLGTVFINMMFCVVVPLVFASIAGSVANMESRQRAGKIMGVTVGTFVITGAIAAVLMFVLMKLFPPVLTPWADMVAEEIGEHASFTEMIVNFFTSSDFVGLLSRRAMLPLIVFSILFGFSVQMTGGKDSSIGKWLAGLSDVMMKFVQIITYYAPIAFFAIFADLVATYGSEVAKGYGRALLVYYPLCFIYIFTAFPLFAWFGGGKGAVGIMFRHIARPAVVSLGTCSSVATIPTNLEEAAETGIDRDIAGMVTSECFMLENITTETQSFQFGTTDLAFVLCLNRHKDASGEYKSSKYIVESLRDEDGFAKSEGAYPVTHILSKRNDEPFYHEVVYLDERESIETLPPLAAELVRLTDEAGT